MEVIMKVTLDQLYNFFENTDDTVLIKFVEPINKVIEEFDINTPKRLSMFLAQIGHESGGLTRLHENLNYKAPRLSQIFPKYFRDVDPEDYANDPEAIANRVYCNRMGNGDEDSGDGYRFRGRGAIQLTGRSNYTACGEDLEVDLIDNPEYLETPEGAIRSAAWFWDKNNLNDWADKGDIVTCTKKINGGTIGLDDRKEHYELALTIFT
jgi:putative chitinase